MKQHIQTAKAYILAHRKNFSLGAAIIPGIFVLLIVAAAIIYSRNAPPAIVYQPSSACDLLTLAEAKDLLGDNTLKSSDKNPAQSENITTSTCGYTDSNPDMNSMAVAAIIVRSGINDKGVEQNKTEFVTGMPKAKVETVKGVGDRAYYNQERGQLNVLDGRNWIIMSYGVGSAPENNTIEQVLKLAEKVVEPPRSSARS